MNYQSIKHESVILTASDSKHAPYLVNAIESIKKNFFEHPKIIIYDLGFSKTEIKEISSYSNTEIKSLKKFCPHYKLNWTWKMHIIVNTPARYILYLDLPNFVFLRSIKRFFSIISYKGYFLVDTGHKLDEIVPSDYWLKFSLSENEFKNEKIFGAGILGVDRNSSAFKAFELANEMCIIGQNLGRSLDEKNSAYQPNITRNCALFRADQTIINITMRKQYGHNLIIHHGRPIYGENGVISSKNQYLWYARRSYVSTKYLRLFRPFNLWSIINRLRWLPKIKVRHTVKTTLIKLGVLNVK